MKFFSKGKEEKKKGKKVTTEGKEKQVQTTSQTTKESEQTVSAPKPKITINLDETLAKDEVVKQIIEIITNSEDGILNPVIDFEKNQITYPLLAQISQDNVVAKLKELASTAANILDEEVYERLPVCPKNPDYLATTLRIYCSSCLSDDVKKLQLVEHKACGYITDKKIFDETAGKERKCISCKKIIKDPEKEIHKLGRWYECNKCKTKFDNSVLKIHCRKFDHDFLVNQAEMSLIHSYKIKTDSKSLHSFAFSLINPIKEIIQSHGFTVDESPTIKGNSGVEHKISIFARNEAENTLLIDIKGAETEIEDSEINAAMVKVMDISPNVAIFIAIPSVSESAKNMAAAQKISLITGKDFNQMLDTIKKILDEKIGSSSKTESTIQTE